MSTGTSIERTILSVPQELLSDNEIERLWRMATALAKGRMFKDVTQAEQAFSKMLIGHYLGMNPAQAMMGIQLVRGGVMFSYPTLGAFIRSRPGYDYKILEHTDDAAEIEFSHEDEVLGTARFTVADAKRAKIIKDGGGWETYPENMCVARALSKGARFFMGEVFFGIPVYVEGEIPPEAELSAGEGNGEARGVELPAEVEDVIRRAESLGHQGWAERSVWEYRKDRGQETLDATLVQARDDLDAMEAAIPDVEVEPDVPIDDADLPPVPADVREAIQAAFDLGEAASEAKEPPITEQADPGSVPSPEGARSEPPAQDPTNAAPTAGSDTPGSAIVSGESADPTTPPPSATGESGSATETAPYIEYLADPNKNALYFRHPGCDGGPSAKWKVPLDDLPLPRPEGAEEECAQCAQSFPVRASEEETKRQGLGGGEVSADAIAPPVASAEADESADGPAVQEPEVDVEALRRRLAAVEKKQAKTEEEESLKDEEITWIKEQLDAAAQTQAAEDPGQGSLI